VLISLYYLNIHIFWRHISGGFSAVKGKSDILIFEIEQAPCFLLTIVCDRVVISVV